MSAAEALSARGLAVGYRRRGKGAAILSALDLSVRRGEFVALLGPNGVGKTTLLRTLAGSLPPLAGTLRLAGRDSAGLRDIERARLLGLVRTERVEVGALTAEAVVGLGRYPHVGWGGRLREADHAAVRRALGAVGALHLARRDVMELSDGERQRVNVARALAQEPAILLLDEPTAYLDVAGRVELMGLLRRLAREGLAVVASTHELELAFRTADRLWLVGPDRAVSEGAPEDLIAAGAFDRLFPSERIAFRPEERAFRLVPDTARSAEVKGTGLGAALAAAVLEREGFDLGDARRPGHLVVTTDIPPGLWRAESGAVQGRGSSFASLARFARDLRTPDDAEEPAVTREKTHAL